MEVPSNNSLSNDNLIIYTKETNFGKRFLKEYLRVRLNSQG